MWRRAALCALALALVPTLLGGATHTTEDDSRSADRLETLVRDLKARLSIDSPVAVRIVPTDALMMSVEPPAEAGGVFLLNVDATFLTALTDAELEAAVAHELGHVWVFTHHPYLQTEQLANQIAMRAVRRETLQHVYEKVWQAKGSKGDLTRFLGGSPSAATD